MEDGWLKYVFKSLPLSKRTGASSASLLSSAEFHDAIHLLNHGLGDSSSQIKTSQSLEGRTGSIWLDSSAHFTWFKPWTAWSPSGLGLHPSRILLSLQWSLLPDLPLSGLPSYLILVPILSSLLLQPGPSSNVVLWQGQPPVANCFSLDAKA